MNPDVQLMKSWINSPIKFIEDIWKLTPQKKEEEFIKGKHITWQQYEILSAIEKGLRGEAPKRIAVASGRGIGKDACLAWLIHWFLFTRYNSQIACTAPTSDQIYDVLWKELMIWNQKLPAGIKEKFEWSSTHYRITESPQTWWARARTAKKESPEAFAGIHGESVMLLGDESSGIEDEIFKIGEGSLTNKDTLVILVSNPRRLEGFFYDCFHKDKANWQTLQFNSIDSPIVERDFAERIKAKEGEDSDEYRYEVLGLFPKENKILEGGWIPLLSEQDLRFVPDTGRFNNPMLGIDPSGAGLNKSAFIVRDNFKAKIAALENKSNPKSVAEISLTLSEYYKVKAENITVDNFGVGSNVSQEIALATAQRVQAINVGEKADNQERFVNKRSENYWRLREWLIKGGKLTGKLEDWKQLLTIYYKRNLSGKIQIMSKEEMFKKGYESPDCFVASTQIKTPFGDKDIKDFKVGDLVVTPFGNRKVIKRWELETNQLCRVKFNNGQELIGKRKHKILTKRGFIPLDTLTLTDIIEVWNTKSRFIWKIKKLLFGGEKSIGLRKQADIFMQIIENKAKDLKRPYITPFGSIILAKQFLRDFIFTIKIAMFSTILMPIWSLNQEESIAGNIWLNDSGTQNIKKEIMKFWKESGHWRANGMEARKEENGIRNTGKELGLAENQKLNFVFIAEKNLIAFLKELSFVLKNVSLKMLSTMEDIIPISELVWNVKRFLWQIGIGLSDVVPVDVQLFTALKTKVYNLTLDRDNVYYANGILVENCADALSLTFNQGENIYGQPIKAVEEASPEELRRITMMY